MEYVLLNDVGTGKVGEIYVKALFTHDIFGNDLYWREGTKKEDYHFFHKSLVESDTKDFKKI